MSRGIFPNCSLVALAVRDVVKGPTLQVIVLRILGSHREPPCEPKGFPAISQLARKAPATTSTSAAGSEVERGTSDTSGSRPAAEDPKGVAALIPGPGSESHEMPKGAIPSG